MFFHFFLFFFFSSILETRKKLIRIDKGLFYRRLAEVSHHHHRVAVAPYLDEKKRKNVLPSLFFFFVLCFFRPSMALKGILFLSIFFFILSRAPLLGSNRCVAFSLLEDFPYRFVYRYSSGANIFFYFFKFIDRKTRKDQKEESLSNVLFDGIYMYIFYYYFSA